MNIPLGKMSFGDYVNIATQHNRDHHLKSVFTRTQTTKLHLP